MSTIVLIIYLFISSFEHSKMLHGALTVVFPWSSRRGKVLRVSSDESTANRNGAAVLQQTRHARDVGR